MEDVMYGIVRERSVRANMASLHATMVKSKDNTETVLTGKLIGMDADTAGGNRSIRVRMARLSEWLEDIRIMSTTPADFENSFMLPIRKAAGFLNYMRGRSPASIDVEGLVFAVSPPYHDEMADEDVCVVSAVFPRLRGVLHLRAKTDITPGWTMFRKVQPIPLVNRLNPTRLRIKKLDKDSVIGGLDFLKCPLSCVGGFKRSLAMENFCEVWSNGADGPRLGATLVVCGRVEHIDRYQVTVCGRDAGSSSMDARLYPDIASGLDSGRLENLHGSWARMLVTVWYHGGDEKTNMLPEAYVIEKTTEEQVVADEITGHVRVFGSARISDMERKYGRIPENMSIAGDVISLSGIPADNDEAAMKFIQTTEDIRAARFKTGSCDIHCQPDEVLDYALTTRYLVGKIKKNEWMRSMLLSIIRRNECYKPPTRKELRESMPNVGDVFSRYLWLLERQFVYKQNDGSLEPTKAGLAGALESVGDDVERAISTNATVFLPDVDVSGSLALMYLGKQARYSPIRIGGFPCSIAWVRQDASDADVDACRRRVVRMLDDAADILFSSYNPITPEYISDKMGGILVPYTNSMMSTLEKTHHVSRDGDSWYVPMRDKMKRTIIKSDDALSLKEIMRWSYVAGVNREKARHAMAVLQGEGVATVLSNGKWLSEKKYDCWVKHAVYDKAKEAAVGMLAARLGGMDEAGFESGLSRRIRDIMRESDRKEYEKLIITQMIDEGIVVKCDGMYRLGAGQKTLSVIKLNNDNQTRFNW